MTERRDCARMMSVTRRSLRNWKRDADDVPGEPRRRPGRPRRSEDERARGMCLVSEMLGRLGMGAGEGTVYRELGGRIPMRLVRECLAKLKAEHRARTRRAREAARTSVRALARGAIWSVDGTHLGRDDAGTAVMGEVVRDVASTKTLGVSIGPPPTSAEVVVLVQRVVEEVGEIPLVLSIDNGGENQGELDAWCKAHGVVRLRNLPRTPQHNPWVEHGNAELKAETGLGKGVSISDVREVAHDVVLALHRIDGARPRRTRDWMTARDAYATLPSAEAQVDRDRFVEAVRCAVDEAVQDCRTARQKRLAERQAILTTMECFGLIKRTRGRDPEGAAIAEDVL